MSKLHKFIAWFKPAPNDKVSDSEKADILLKSFPKCC